MSDALKNVVLPLALLAPLALLTSGLVFALFCLAAWIARCILVQAGRAGETVPLGVPTKPHR